jgi:hypothetical protein
VLIKDLYLLDDVHIFLFKRLVHIGYPLDSYILENTFRRLRGPGSRWRFRFLLLLLLLLYSDSPVLLLLVGIPGYHVVGPVPVCHDLIM